MCARVRVCFLRVRVYVCVNITGARRQFTRHDVTLPYYPIEQQVQATRPGAADEVGTQL